MLRTKTRVSPLTPASRPASSCQATLSSPRIPWVHVCCSCIVGGPPNEPSLLVSRRVTHVNGSPSCPEEEERCPSGGAGRGGEPAIHKGPGCFTSCSSCSHCASEAAPSGLDVVYMYSSSRRQPSGREAPAHTQALPSHPPPAAQAGGALRRCLARPCHLLPLNQPGLSGCVPPALPYPSGSRAEVRASHGPPGGTGAQSSAARWAGASLGAGIAAAP